MFPIVANLACSAQTVSTPAPFRDSSKQEFATSFDPLLLTLPGESVRGQVAQHASIIVRSRSPN
jgi:hypothetical protein